MRVKNIKVSNSRLKEGSQYPFKILKLIDLGDGQSNFVLQDPLGYKVLVPAKYYTGYGFEAGQGVMCRVDRINCNGRMFLEPMHPFYKEGQRYDFEILGQGVHEGITGEPEHYIEVKDILGHPWKVKIFKGQNVIRQTGALNCFLERIKKGHLFLRPAGEEFALQHPNPNKAYSFQIVDERMNPENKQKYFILYNEDVGKQILPKKFYWHYGLKKGVSIDCRVGKLTSDGYYTLEPENPWYKRDEIYEFKLLEIHKLHFSDGSVQDVLVLDDPYNEPVKVFVEKEKLDRWHDKEKIQCKVAGFRKSRPYLVVI
jgi:hypothetical protein